MKFTLIKPNKIWQPVLLVFVITIFAQCKKTDAGITPDSKQLYAAKFFEKPATVSAEVETIIDLLYKENEKSGFVNTLPDNAGLPVWDKTITGKPTTNYAARGVFIDQYGNYLISLSNNKVTLSALLFAMKKDGKYEFFYYDNNYAYGIAFSDKYSIQQRENVMGLFVSMSNYVFGITKFKNIPKELFAGINEEIIDEGGETKKMFLKPPSGTPPIILSSLGVVGTQETCVYKFSGTCNCDVPTVNHAGHCRDWMTGCVTCSISDCELFIFEEVPGTDPPPTNPNGGTGAPGTTGTSSSSSGVAGPGGPLPNTTTGGLPNAFCSNNCAWYTEMPEQNFETDPCTPSESNNETLVFNNYVQMKIDPSVVETNNSSNSSNPITGSYVWSVAKALFGSWRVDAVTNYSYYHTRYYTVDGTLEDNFDLFSFNTGEGYFVGSQTFIVQLILLQTQLAIRFLITIPKLPMVKHVLWELLSIR